MLILIWPTLVQGGIVTTLDSSTTTTGSPKKYVLPDTPFRFQDFHLKLSYWNDNFGYQNDIREIITPGKDDGVTAAFRFQYGILYAGQETNLDLYYAILTNRESNYRTDLIALRLTNEKNLNWGWFMVGLGVMAQGNFGGARLQNWYHEQKGYDLIDLDYLDETVLGLTGIGRVRKNLWTYKQTTLSGFTTATVRTFTGVSFVRGGMVLNQSVVIPKIDLPLQLQLTSGAFYYFPTLKVFSPLFKKGLMVGGLGSTSFARHWVLSLWATLNQYGLESPHYGMTLVYQSKSFRPTNLRSVFFP